MQFIEKNSFSVRSAIYVLKTNGDSPVFMLFPMIHVGTVEFYNEIRAKLAPCDLILLEGVASQKVHLLTLSYRIVKNIRRMDLVTQTDALQLSQLKNKIIFSDVTGAAFDEGWSSLPLWIRAGLFLVLPFWVANLLFFGSRDTIAKDIAFEDLPSAQETLMRDDEFDRFDELLVDSRDRELIRHIEKLILEGQSTGKTIAILYGARHMRNVVNFLHHKLNYRVVKAEWVTVFDL